MTKLKLYALLSIGLIVSAGLARASESPSTAPADPSDGLCRDLYKLSCKPYGEFSDGTGKAQNLKDWSVIKQSLKDKHGKAYREKFRTALHKEENSDFKKIALSTFGLTNSPDCESKSGNSQIKCLDRLADQVTEIAFAQVFSSAGRSGGSTPDEPRAFQADEIEDIQYLISNSAYEQLRDKLAADAQQVIADPKLIQKIESDIFPRVRSLFIEKIKKLVKDEKTREQLEAKVKSVRWSSEPCFANEYQAYSIAPHLMPNAMLDGLSKKIQYCGGMLLTNTSEFQIAFVLAHELGHSIDPCGIELGPEDFTFRYSKDADQKMAESENPFSAVIQCLRGDKSIKAARYTPTVEEVNAAIMSGGGPYGYPGGGMGATPVQTKPEQPEPFSFCGKIDQIGEGFSDWMAAEVLPEYLAKHHSDLSQEQIRSGYSNVFRGWCSDRSKKKSNDPDDEEEKFDTHSFSEDRINRILLVNPVVRKQMGCSEQHQDFIYCSQGSQPTYEAPSAKSSQSNPQIIPLNPKPPQIKNKGAK